MPNPNVRGIERAALAGVINPQSLSPGSASSGWVSLAAFERATALLSVGAITANGTVDAKLEQATDSGGTGVKDITGKAITQLTDAGTDDNKQVAIEVTAAELDVANEFTHVRLTVTTATAAALVAAVVLGFDARYNPLDGDVTTLDEIVD